MSRKDEPEVLRFVKTSLCIFPVYLHPTEKIKKQTQ